MKFDEAMLSGYLDGELNDEEVRVVQKQLAEDRQSRETLEALRSLRTQLLALPAEVFSADPVAAVRKRIAQGAPAELAVAHDAAPVKATKAAAEVAYGSGGVADGEVRSAAELRTEGNGLSGKLPWIGALAAAACLLVVIGWMQQSPRPMTTASSGIDKRVDSKPAPAAPMAAPMAAEPDSSADIPFGGGGGVASGDASSREDAIREDASAVVASDAPGRGAGIDPSRSMRRAAPDAPAALVAPPQADGLEEGSEQVASLGLGNLGASIVFLEPARDDDQAVAVASADQEPPLMVSSITVPVTTGQQGAAGRWVLSYGTPGTGGAEEPVADVPDGSDLSVADSPDPALFDRLVGALRSGQSIGVELKGEPLQLVAALETLQGALQAETEAVATGPVAKVQSTTAPASAQPVPDLVPSDSVPVDQLPPTASGPLAEATQLLRGSRQLFFGPQALQSLEEGRLWIILQPAVSPQP